ncbi:hypothetical protein ACFVYD_10910 [Streptomyces sp. NPDC058301]|uniref:hypothetical protein n=1 Tax=Streptomyces sp. NPDC058301 TaxID=3346436 RepID=UPI0036E4B343
MSDMMRDLTARVVAAALRNAQVLVEDYAGYDERTRPGAGSPGAWSRAKPAKARDRAAGLVPSRRRTIHGK